MMSCYILDVIMSTLSKCDYNECNDMCRDYLIDVSTNCPVVFHNQEYERLWNTLFNICFGLQEQVQEQLQQLS